MYTIKRWTVALKQNRCPEYTIEIIAENLKEAIKLAEDRYGHNSLLENPKEIVNRQ